MNIGTEIYKENAIDIPLTNINDINAGDEIMIAPFNSWVKAKVISKGIATYKHYSVPLLFDNDDRHCWINLGFINEKAIEKLI